MPEETQTPVVEDKPKVIRKRGESFGNQQEPDDLIAEGEIGKAEAKAPELILTLTVMQSDFDARAAYMKTQGIEISSPDGTIDHDGVEVTYTYANNTLNVYLVKKPLLYPEGVIESKLKAWFLAPLPTSTAGVLPH